MILNHSEGGAGGRVWTFGPCEFEEWSRELRVHGALVEVESKPLDVLQQLLLNPGEIVTREELLEAAWPGVTVVEGSLATAVSKLRKVLDAKLGDSDATSMIVTIPRVGYRLGVPVQCKQHAAPAAFPDLGLHAGDAVPGRDQWRLARPLDKSGSSEVWLGEHPKTHEQRVFKFAQDGFRLKGLKREVTVARVLRESFGDRPDFVRVLEWNFDTKPYFLESEFCGENLAEWAASQGGLGKIPLEARLDVLTRVAGAVSAAHSLGILHKDLKPANLLMTSGQQVKVADFGSADLLDPARLSSLGITNLGFTQTVPGAPDLTGTLMYLPPEVLAGQPPTAAADVYALGVLLYQMAAGDFRKPLAPGWEADIADPLLREDIAGAACGDPARRLASAAALATRLRTLDQRRIERNELAQARQRAQAAEQRLAQSRARRPWAIAAGLLLAAGLVTSLSLYRRAAAERDRANRQTEIAAAVNRFLSNDLLGRSDPFQSGKSGETLIEAVKQATPAIDRQFQAAPEVAARLHHAIARALDNRTDWPAARASYQRAQELYGNSEEATIVQLQRAAMEARTYEKGSLERAQALLGQALRSMASTGTASTGTASTGTASTGMASTGMASTGMASTGTASTGTATPASPSPEVAVWLASARGMVALIGNNAKEAAAQFQLASDGAAKLPAFDENARLTLQQRLAFSAIRLGDAPRAEKLFRELIAAFTRIAGADSPAVLRVRLNLAQAYMIGQKHEEAVRETTAIYPQYVARLGEDHELALQVLTTRAQSEGSLGRWADSARDGLKVHALAVKKQGPQSFFAVAALSDAALAECRAGDWQTGTGHARQAHAASVKAFGARAGLTGGTASTLANCLIGLAQWNEAAALLDSIDIKATTQLAGDPDWFAGVELARAEIAVGRHDAAEARSRLSLAEPVFAKPTAEEYQKKTVARLRAALGAASH